MPGSDDLAPEARSVPAAAVPPLPSATTPKNWMVNQAAMSRLEGHSMPCARPVDVFFTSPAPDDSPTIKRYREPRILAPVHRSQRFRPPTPSSPRRRKSSATFHTPTASPRAYKTAKGPQGVERALVDLMQSLKVAAASPSAARQAETLVSRWSDSESGRERDASGFTWFSRKSDKSRAHTPSSSLDSTRQTQRPGESFKRFAASIKSKSSLSSIRSIKSGRGKRAVTPAPEAGGIGSGDETSYLPSTNSSTWSFATPLTPATPNLATATAPPLPEVSARGTKGPGHPGQPKSQKLQGFVKRLTAKRSRGPIPESFMPRVGRHIPHQGLGAGTTTLALRISPSSSPTLSSYNMPNPKLQGTKRLASRQATPAGATGSGLARAGSNNGQGDYMAAPACPQRLEVREAADASSLSTTTPPLPTTSTMTSSRAEFRSVNRHSRVPGGQLGQTKQPLSRGATNATLTPASAAPSDANKRTLAGSFTRARARPEVIIPASSDMKGDNRGVSSASFISASPDQSESPSHSTPITPTAKRKSSLPPSHTPTATITTTVAGTGTNVRKRRSILTLITSPTTPAFPTFHLHSPLRRRTQIPPGLILQTQPPNEPATMATDNTVHMSPTGSPHLSPMMPCNRPLSKAESILGVRLRRTGSGFSLDHDRAGSPIVEGDSAEEVSSDDEVISFSTPRHGRRATALTFQSVVSPPGSPPARPASPSRWLTTSASHPNICASAAAKASSLATPDLSFESLSELSEAIERHAPSTPPHSPALAAVSGRAVRAAVMAAAADPATKPRRLLHSLTGQRRAGRKASRTFSAVRSESAPAHAPPVPPLPTEFGVRGHLTPPLGAQIAPSPSLYPASLYAPSASHGSLNDVISRNFSTLPQSLASSSSSSSTPTPLAPRPRPPSVQLVRGHAPPIPIAPDARLPPHSSKRRPQWPEWPPRWDPAPAEDEYSPGREVTPAPLLPSNASVHTFGTSAASYRSRASNASSVFDFSKRDDAMDVDVGEESEEEAWEWDQRQGAVRA